MPKLHGWLAGAALAPLVATAGIGVGVFAAGAFAHQYGRHRQAVNGMDDPYAPFYKAGGTVGMVLGGASHHIADLCTPVHVGHGADAKALGFRGPREMHRRFERDLERHASKARLQLSPARKVKLSLGFFWRIAERTYETWYRRLADIYLHAEDELLMEMASDVLSQAVRYTKDVWHTVLLSTGMTDRKWSKQPLL